MLGGETVKELYGRDKRYSVRGIASDLSITRATGSQVRALAGGAEPQGQTGSADRSWTAYREHIDVRVSEVLENCVALIVDAASDRTTGSPQLRSSVWCPRGTSVVHHTDTEQEFCGLERAAGRHGDSDGDPQQAAAPESRAQHPRRELQAEGQASGQSANVPPAVHINILRLTLTEGIRMRVNQIQLGENARRPTAH